MLLLSTGSTMCVAGLITPRYMEYFGANHFQSGKKDLEASLNHGRTPSKPTLKQLVG
jgi:hypothetical protein